ncbi:MAG: hypothetical protein M3Q50_15445, partial [Chloroflexota bacterium]|nr:hypothetical protein [Chloroflexota bacterium]
MGDTLPPKTKQEHTTHGRVKLCGLKLTGGRKAGARQAAAPVCWHALKPLAVLGLSVVLAALSGTAAAAAAPLK